MTRIPQLDGLRGLAALMVVFCHDIGFGLWGLPEPGTIGSFFYWITACGFLGVDMLFVLSGFLLGSILFENREASNYYRVFYKRRFARLLPLYAVWVLLFYVLRDTVTPDTAPYNLMLANPAPWWSYASLTQNFFSHVSGGTLRAGMMLPTWSLAVEEHFYFMLPFLVRLVPLRIMPWALISLVASAPVVRTSILCLGDVDDRWMCYSLLPCRWDSLFLGVLAAWLWRKGIISHRATGLGLLLFGGGLAIVLSFGIYNLNPPMIVIGYTLAGLCIATLMLRIVQNPARMTWFGWGPLCWIGKVSYALYISHLAIHIATHWFVLGSVPQLKNWPVTLLGVGIAIAVASASWLWFEKPILDRWRSEPYSTAKSRAARGSRRSPAPAT